MPSPKELAKALAYQGEIRNTSRNRLLGGVADLLAPVSEFADRDKLPESIPLLGGMSFADLSGLKGAQSLIEDMSYGKSPVRGATLNTVKVDPRLLDLAGVSGAMMPVGKAALREVAKQIQNKTGFARFMPNTRMGVVPEGQAMSAPDKQGAMNDGSQDVITYIGRKGQKFQITKQRDNELLDIHSSIADKAREIFGDGVESFDSGMSSSRYVKLPNGAKIRVSDHPLPSDFAAMHGVPDVEVRGGQDLQKAIDYMIDAKSNKTMPNSQKRYDDLSLRDELRSNGVPLFAVDARQIRKLVNSGVGYDDIANQLQQKYPKLTDSDAAKIYTVIGRGKFDKFDVPVKDQIVRYGDNVGGAMMQRPKTEFEILHDTAQRNAALPVEQGGLGLPSGNTAMDRANAPGMFPEDAVHFSRAGGDYTTLDSGKYAIAPFDAVGTHVGTPQAAMERFRNTVGYKVNDPNYINDELKGTSYPVRISNSNPLMNQNGMPFGEEDLNTLLRQAGGHNSPDISGGDRELNAKLRKKLFEDQGYTNIPYFNEVEGRGSVSQIVPPSNIRSRFAAFDPFRRHEADILAGVGVGGMLDPQAIAEALRQQDRK